MMKTKRLQRLLLCGLLCLPLYVLGQSNSIVFVNAGPMYVGGVSAADTVLTVLGSMGTEESTESVITQTGVSTLTGSFYHNADSHAFLTGTNDGWATSPESLTTGWNAEVTGTIVFKGTSSERRYITTSNFSTFNRTDNYAAFPNITIATNDTLFIPAQMGLDAETIVADPNFKGKMRLQSDTTVVGRLVYDASLRLKNHDTEADTAIIIERDLSLYRAANGTGVQPLFAFAAPLKNMYSGYFAGNWVRRMLQTGANKHVDYVYGNKPNPNNTSVIDYSQYMMYATENLTPGEAYLIKARPANFDYSNLQAEGGLTATGATDASLYNKNKFVFDAHAYNLTPQHERVYANDTLFDHTISGTVDNQLNWVIGNSWTSAISLQALDNYIKVHPTIYFRNIVWLFPSGSTTYQPYFLTGHTLHGTQLLDGITSIPSQSIFVIQVLSDAQATISNKGDFTQAGRVTLKKQDLQVHDNVPHNLSTAAGALPPYTPSAAPALNPSSLQRSVSSTTSYQNDALFRLTPESNSNIFDLAAIALRPNSQEAFEAKDLKKSYLTGNEAFTLYTLSSDDEKLAVNTAPLTTPYIRLCVDPGIVGGRMVLTASRTESFNAIWLEDLLTHDRVDLKTQTDYIFESTPQDTPDRFLVYFTEFPTPTDAIDPIVENFLQCYYHAGDLVMKGLLESDLGGVISIFDVQGRLLKKEIITNAPEMHLPLSLTDGVYLAKLQGKRNVTVKLMKGQGK
ncbi:MAG: T9SS type A sorting domain-containing protein [Prevotellaceae bacterium]|nr:T9SS type A sorting domain-containing protein [Prevotellaceae bacterium]